MANECTVDQFVRDPQRQAWMPDWMSPTVPDVRPAAFEVGDTVTVRLADRELVGVVTQADPDTFTIESRPATSS